MRTNIVCMLRSKLERMTTPHLNGTQSHLRSDHHFEPPPQELSSFNTKNIEIFLYLASFLVALVQCPVRVSRVPNKVFTPLSKTTIEKHRSNNCNSQNCTTHLITTTSPFKIDTKYFSLHFKVLLVTRARACCFSQTSNGIKNSSGTQPVSFLSFQSETFHFPGQESDQSDAHGKPGQENQGRGGSEASLDLPEREGGLRIPQVRHLTPQNQYNFYLSLGKKLWTA